LSEFAFNMYQLVRYNHYASVDTLYYADIPENSSPVSRIVSCIEFDRDDTVFAAGGVTKDIKIFDFSMLPSPHPSIHCPMRVLRCGHKISCLSWSPYLQWQLASSDYEGHIDIWDCSRGTKTQSFTDHTRRAWSVDVCKANPTWVASGSDDHTVRIWSLTQQKAVHTLEQKGNVCCAKFAPTASHFVAVGSADHHVSLYDLRMAKLPVKVYEGHGKAVSYVKWLNDYEIVSA
jgi:E3 ubiquitin-protein ligase RFWD2